MKGYLLLDLLATVLYRLVAIYLPSSGAPLGALWCRARSILARRMLHTMGSGVNIESGALFSSQRLVSLGARSGIGIKCRLYGPVSIGDDVMMGPEVLIYGARHDVSRTDIPMIDQGEGSSRVVKIESDVWIGTRVIILPGVTVGRGSIIGAGAVVSKDVPQYSVTAGNPARVVKFRC